ncbi:MAG: hypothetical protein HPY52_10925 [Firmicutes bacterium]|nr:hypothetical protein [Bacillota bacterium]
MDDIGDIILSQAENAVKKLGVRDIVSPEEVARSITSRSTYWEKPMPTGERLLFIRLFSGVVQREETFLGNILFNAFLSKAFLRAVSERNLGHMELVANDLENYYFLARTTGGIEELAGALRAEVERSLPDLFFGAPSESQGIYGDLGRMFTFRKSDFEPFPVYAIPHFLAPNLEKAVREQVRKLLTGDQSANSIRTILAAIAFFYGRTSSGSGDAQSFPNFADHLVNDAGYDGLLKADEVRRAFNIPEVTKAAIKESIDTERYSRQELRALLSGLLDSFATSIDSGSGKWFMGFLHKKEKFIALPAHDYVDLLLADIQLGYHLFRRITVAKRVPCRLCNIAEALVEDRYVTMGLNSFKFNNQSVRHQAAKVCPRCALYSYLAQKLLGTEMVSAGGKLPQVPKTYNLIFHYGMHTNDEIQLLASRIDQLWDLIRRHRDIEQIRRENVRQVQALAEKMDHERDAARRSKLAEELASKKSDLEVVQANLANAEQDITHSFPWLKEMGGSLVPAENCFLDIMANLQISETRVERHVLGLGIDGYRMILFVLPQIRAPRDAKEHDFAQRRFSNSRITVTVLLSFLRELCGCDGPFYYQSLPTLSLDAFRRDTFYVRNEPIDIAQVHDEYEVVTQLAWKLVHQRGSEGFVRKVVLAERLLEDPLATFAEVMRDSPVLGQTKGSYKRLPGNYRQDWGAYNMTEYAKFINKLWRLQEVK